MNVEINDVEQLRMLWENIRNNIQDEYGIEKLCSDLFKMSIGWLTEKQNIYKNEKYLEKIENNAVYLNEAASACIKILTEYLTRDILPD